MITLTNLPDGKIHCEQKLLEPTIYLDQWMWSRLSRESDLRARFVRAVSQCQGCIMYSMTSFIELAQIEDASQLRALEELMDSVDFGFLEADPIRVIELERKHESEITGIFNGRHPAVDQDMLSIIVRYSPDIPRISAILKDLKEDFPVRYAAMAERLSASLTPLIESARSDAAVLKRAKRINKDRRTQRTGPPYTADILRTVNFFLVSNERMKMNRNEWMDIMHLVVPVSYLDHVLLDKRWVNFVRNHLPLVPPDIAKVYGPREIELFHQNLC